MRFYALHNKSNKVKAINMTFLRISAIGLLVLVAWQPGLVMAQYKMPIPKVCVPDTIPFNPLPVDEGKTVAQMPLDLEADQIEVVDKDTVILTGNAHDHDRSVRTGELLFLMGDGGR